MTKRKNPTPPATLSIYVTRNFKEKLLATAAEEGKSLSYFACEVLTSYLEKKAEKSN